MKRERGVIVRLGQIFILWDQIRLQTTSTANNGAIIIGNVEPLLFFAIDATLRVLIVRMISMDGKMLTFF